MGLGGHFVLIFLTWCLPYFCLLFMVIFALWRNSWKWLQRFTQKQLLQSSDLKKNEGTLGAGIKKWSHFQKFHKTKNNHKKWGKNFNTKWATSEGGNHTRMLILAFFGKLLLLIIDGQNILYSKYKILFDFEKPTLCSVYIVRVRVSTVIKI